MASWMLANASSPLSHITRILPRPVLSSRHTRLFPHVISKAFASALSVSAEINPSDMTPSMEAMLKQPPRASGWDRSLFEETTDEYGQAAAEVDSTAEQQRPCYVLHQLVDAGDFVTAARVKAELESIGVIIQPDIRYMAAAVQALSVPARKGPDLSSTSVSSFDGWAALVPVPEAVRDCKFFHSNTFAKLPSWKASTLRHAIVAAHMGYSSKIALHIVPWAMRWVTIGASRGFMQAFADADLAYREAKKSRASEENKKHFKSWYALAIRTRCTTNDTRSACTLLRDALNRDYDVPLLTLKILLTQLREKHDTKNASWVAKRYWTLKEKGTASPDTLSVEGRRLLYYQMRKALIRGHMPTRIRLYAFIHQCIHSGDPKLFHYLLRRIHNHPDYERAIRQWASAEMSYYLDSHKELAALYVFRQYFRPSSIPKAMVLMFHRLDYKSLPKYLTAREIPQPAAVWPNAQITGYLWPIFFKALRQDQIKYAYLEFESLFDAHTLLQSSRPSASPEKMKEALSLRRQGRIPPPGAPSPFELDNFRQFLHAIAKYNDTKLLVTVIKKMTALGWYPRRGDMSAITGCFARGGSPDRLIPLLEELRSDFEKHSASMVTSSGSATVRGVGEDAPRPAATAMYRNAVRSMMDVGRYAAAGKLARHLRRRIGYRFGANSKTDRTLGILYTELKRVSHSLIFCDCCDH